MTATTFTMPTFKANLLFKWIKEQHFLGKNIKDSDKYFIIPLPGPPKHNLFAQKKYKCIERHVRIDKFFSDKNKFLSYWHYTEVYSLYSANSSSSSNSSSNQNYTVHVFFDEYQRCVNVDIQPSVTDQELIRLDLMSNSQEAYQYMLNLIAEKNNQRWQEQVNLAQMLKELELLSYNLDTSDDIKTYISKASKYLQDEKESHNYIDINENISAASERISEIVIFLENKLKKSHQEMKNDNLQGEAVSVKSDASSEYAKIEFTGIEDAKKIVSGFYNEDKENLNEKINFYEASCKLRAKLLMSDGQPKCIKLAMNILKKMSGTTIMDDLFKQCIKNGAADLFKRLYILKDNQFDSEIVLELRKRLLESDSSTLPSLIDISKFLFENSVGYRYILEESAYIGGINHLTVIIQREKKDVFDLWLNQGAAINAPAMLTDTVVSLVRVASRVENPYYLEQLLKRGAYVDYKYETENQMIASFKKHKAKIYFLNGVKSPEISNANKSFFEEYYLGHRVSDLQSCIGDIEKVKMLLPYSSLPSIAIALASVACTEKMTLLVDLVGDEGGVCMLTAFSKFTGYHSPDQCYLLCGIESNGKPDEMMLHFDILCKYFKKRCKEYQIEEFNSFVSTIDSYYYSSGLSSAASARESLFAKLFLIAEKGHLSDQDKKYIMKICTNVAEKWKYLSEFSHVLVQKVAESFSKTAVEFDKANNEIKSANSNNENLSNTSSVGLFQGPAEYVTAQKKYAEIVKAYRENEHKDDDKAKKMIVDLKQCIATFRQHKKQAAATACSTLASLYRDMSDLSNALLCLDESFALFKQCGIGEDDPSFKKAKEKASAIIESVGKLQAKPTPT